jgi:hypothetical protein
MKAPTFHIPVISWAETPVSPVETLSTPHRLVVLIPNGEFNDQEFSLKIGKLGQQSRRNILFLGLASYPAQDSLLRRRMANLSAYTCSAAKESSYRLIYRADWLEALREVLQADDQVVCLEDHFIPGRFFRSVRLAQQIKGSLDTPVCMVKGIPIQTDRQQKWWRLREILAWISLLLTILLFLFIQIRLTQAYPGMLGTILGAISVVMEFGAVLFLNTLFDQLLG